MKLNIALVAHDARKKELIEWAEYNKEWLSQHNLFGTGTTGRLLKENCELDVTGLMSGPLGGDAQIGAMIAEGEVNLLIFFCDNLSTQGHQNDIFGLVRLASLYNIPFATNRTTADCIITSPLLNEEAENYEIKLPAAIDNYRNRKL